MFADDNDGWLPARGMGTNNWPTAFRSYLGLMSKGSSTAPLPMMRSNGRPIRTRTTAHNTAYIINGFS